MLKQNTLEINDARNNQSNGNNGNGRKSVMDIDLNKKSLMLNNLNLSKISSVCIDEKVEKKHKQSELKLQKVFDDFQNSNIVPDEFSKEEHINKDYKFDDYHFINDLFEINTFEKMFKEVFLLKGRKKFIIYEQSIFFRNWSIFIFVLMSLLLIQMPLQVSEPNLGAGQYEILILLLDLTIDCMFIIDICINFMVPQADDNGRLIDDHYLIGLRQVQSWFFVDFVSSLPISFIVWLMGQNESTQIDEGNTLTATLLKIPRQQKFMRLAKLMRIFKALKQQQILKDLLVQLNISSTHLNMFAKSIVLLLFCHVMSSIQIFIQTFEEENWFFNYSDGYSIFPEDDIQAKQSISWQFVFQTVTTVGQGDVGTMNRLEMFFKIVLIIIGVQIWSFIIATITEAQLESVIDNIQDRTIKEKIDHINNKQRLSLKSMWNMDMLVHSTENFFLGKEYELILSLPDKYSKEIIDEIFTFFNQKLTFFNNKPQDFFIGIYKNLYLKQYGDGEYLWMKGDHLDKVFLVGGGKVSFNHDIMKKYSLSSEGAFNFIEVDNFLGLDESYLHEVARQSAISQENTEIQQIKKIQFMNIICNQEQTRFLQDSVTKSFESYVSTGIAIFFILHLFKKCNLQVENQDMLELLKTFQIFNLKKEDQEEEGKKSFLMKQLVNQVDTYLKEIHRIDIDKSVQQLLYNRESNISPWYLGFLKGTGQARIITSLTHRYILNVKSIGILEKFLFPSNLNMKQKYLEMYSKKFTMEKIVMMNTLNFGSERMLNEMLLANNSHISEEDEASEDNGFARQQGIVKNSVNDAFYQEFNEEEYEHLSIRERYNMISEGKKQHIKLKIANQVESLINQRPSVEDTSTIDESNIETHKRWNFNKSNTTYFNEQESESKMKKRSKSVIINKPIPILSDISTQTEPIQIKDEAKEAIDRIEWREKEEGKINLQVKDTLKDYELLKQEMKMIKSYLKNVTEDMGNIKRDSIVMKNKINKRNSSNQDHKKQNRNSVNIGNDDKSNQQKNTRNQMVTMNSNDNNIKSNKKTQNLNMNSRKTYDNVINNNEKNLNVNNKKSSNQNSHRSSMHNSVLNDSLEDFD